MTQTSAVTVPQSVLRMLGYLTLGNIALVGSLLTLFGARPVSALACAAVVGVSAALATVAVIRQRPRVVIKSDGFVVYKLFGETAHKWEDIDGPFAVIKIMPWQKAVAYNLSPGCKAGVGKKPARAFSGYHSAVSGLFKLSPEELADLLNQEKQRWLNAGNDVSGDSAGGQARLTLADDEDVPWAAAAESPQGSEHVAELDPDPEPSESRSPLESAGLGANIRRSEHGETLAVLALLLPLVALGVALACGLESWRIQAAVGWGMVVITAWVLALDAAFLGTTDLRGARRCGPVALFFGLILLWIVFYPAVFFRRRHFGRPNLGPLALLVAGFFFAVPFVRDFGRLGAAGGGVPACDSREVIGMVEDIILKSHIGPSVRSISGHCEISYDPGSRTRKGQCLITTWTETMVAVYRVKVLDPTAGAFVVEVEPITPRTRPPARTPR
jgi:hypothetical protein